MHVHEILLITFLELSPSTSLAFYLLEFTMATIATDRLALSPCMVEKPRKDSNVKV